MSKESLHPQLSHSDLVLIEDVCKAFSNLTIEGIAKKLQYILGISLLPIHYFYIGFFIGQMAQPTIIVPNSLN